MNNKCPNCGCNPHDEPYCMTATHCPKCGYIFKISFNGGFDMRTFKDIKVGDIVVAYDEYSHDYNEHLIKIDSIEYDKEYVTETNSSGMICYGTDLEEEEWGDDYITFIHEGNFVSIVQEKDQF